MKKIITTIDRVRPSDFGIVEKIGKHSRFEDGVFIYNDGEGDDYFSCDLPLCQNGDRIAIGDICEVTFDDIHVDIVDLVFCSDVRSYFMITFQDDDGRKRTVHTHMFEQVIF